MKKIIVLLVTVLLTGCGGRDAENLPVREESRPVPTREPVLRPDPNPTPVVTPAATPVPAPVPLPETPTELPPEPTPEPMSEPEPTATPGSAGLVSVPSTTVPAGVVNPFPTTFRSPYTADGQLCRERNGWGFVRQPNNQPPPLPGGRWGFDIRRFNALHLGDISERNVYLTFDLGYEYRFTPVILDILRDTGVPAAFFITGGYLNNNHDLVRRMVDEGHVVANHGRHHRRNHELTEEQLVFEITEVERLFYELTGEQMSRFYRPPYGEFSAFSLYITQQLGWKTVLWSIAYYDWNTRNQPGRDFVINHFQQNIHNGAIPLMHPVSQSNAEALPYVIEWLLGEGYVFRTLYELP